MHIYEKDERSVLTSCPLNRATQSTEVSAVTRASIPKKIDVLLSVLNTVLQYIHFRPQIHEFIHFIRYQYMAQIVGTSCFQL